MLIILIILAVGLLIFLIYKFSDRSKFVNLGLPSGTLWAKENLNGKFSGSYSAKYFAEMLPTINQWKELQEYCRWEWAGNGFMIYGSNKNSIFLPAEGERINNKIIYEEGKKGNYMVFDGTEDGLVRFNFWQTSFEFASKSYSQASVRLINKK